jgi:hypothetical protein
VAPDQFRLLAGGDRLSDYQFKSKTIHHLFCPVCGIRSCARGKGPDGSEMVASTSAAGRTSTPPP